MQSRTAVKFGDHSSILDSWPIVFSGYPNVKLLGMWNWNGKASQIAVSGISNFTFLRGIERATIQWPNPRLRGTDTWVLQSTAA